MHTWVDVFGLYIFNPVTWKAPSSGTGNTYKVFQQNIDFDYVDPDTGLSNLEKASMGNAPLINKNGKMERLELHHSRQQGHGPIFELSKSTHRVKKGFGREALHPYGGHKNPYDPVDRKLFDKDRKSYWKDRAIAEKSNRMSGLRCK